MSQRAKRIAIVAYLLPPGPCGFSALPPGAALESGIYHDLLHGPSMRRPVDLKAYFAFFFRESDPI
jgi:hypothetical protein